MIEILLEAERALSVGQLDHAERLYRQASDADPRNSIAVVGLARIALERSDDLGAYLLARKALAIDPENEAARRLAARLLEIMRTRGEQVPTAVASMPPRPDGRPAGSSAGSQTPPASRSAPTQPGDRRRKRKGGFIRRLLGR